MGKVIGKKERFITTIDHDLLCQFKEECSRREVDMNHVIDGFMRNFVAGGDELDRMTLDVATHLAGSIKADVDRLLETIKRS